MEKVLKHEMVPKHEVLSKKEVEELLLKFNVSRPQLPGIMTSDPAIKGLEFREGDIVKITRISPVTGTSYAFRVVVSS